MTLIAAALFIGIATTALTDLWSLVVARLLHQRPNNWKLPGRWFAHIPRGRLCHRDIAAAPEIAGEQAVGWICHYAVGTAFALILLLWGGPEWRMAPTLLPALVWGLLTIGFGWFLMQPCMGLGIAAARTPRPGLVRGQGLAAHLVFGFGLWFFARVFLALVP